MRSWVLALLAFGVLWVHAGLHAHWLVDDAGISLAFSRNLAAGHGHVPQPGLPPVEGYSNPLWVYLWALIYRAGVVALPGTVKQVSLGLLALCFLLVARLAGKVSHRPGTVTAFALLACALNPAFVMWGVSGLENPLHVLGVLSLALATVSLAEQPGSPGPARAGALGLLAGSLAWVRPEGIAWVLLPPLCLAPRRPTAAYLAGAATPVVALLALRLAVFGTWLPNTHLVKGGGGLDVLLAVALLQPQVVERAVRLSVSLLGYLTSTALVLGCAGLLAGPLRRRGTAPGLPIVAGFAASSALLYLLLPPDWMTEHRFATPLYPLAGLTLGATLAAWLRPAPDRPRPPEWVVRIMPPLVLGMLLAAALPDFAFRARRVHETANISLDYVRRAYVQRTARWARELGLEEASVGLSDVGAMLLESPLRVHDLAGLCDREMARRLASPDVRARRDHVLGTLRPTFLHVVHIWARDLALGEDPRFERDYLPLYEYSPDEDPGARGARSGWYLRRDVARGREAAVEAIRAEPFGLELDLRPPPPSRLGAVLEVLAPGSEED